MFFKTLFNCSCQDIYSRHCCSYQFVSIHQESGTLQIKSVIVPRLCFRLGAISMTAKRPAVVITTDLDIWVGNTTDTACTMGPVELFGYNTGAYEEVVVPGNSVK